MVGTEELHMHPRGPYVYERIIPFSSAVSGLESGWLPWDDRCVRITGAAELISMTPEQADIDPMSHTARRSDKFYINCMDVTRVTIRVVEDEDDPGDVAEEVGLVVKCCDMSDRDTCFRTILNRADLKRFQNAMRLVSKFNNLDKIWGGELRVPNIPTPPNYFAHRSKISVARRATSFIHDPGDTRSKAERISWKRGAFLSLPIWLDNDLLHGAWCLVAAAALLMLTCVVALQNHVWVVLGSRPLYVAPGPSVAGWVLLLLASILGTWAALVFVRAFTERPMMAPMFSSTHFGSDELLASWLLFLSTLPLGAFSIIFFASPHYQALLFICGIVIAIISCAAALFMTRASYPSDRPEGGEVNTVVALLRRLGGVLSLRQQHHYLQTDWLAGWWAVTYASAAGGAVALGRFVYEAYVQGGTQKWVFGTMAVESALVALGASYFVAGSYPDRPGRAVRSRRRSSLYHLGAQLDLELRPFVGAWRALSSGWARRRVDALPLTVEPYATREGSEVPTIAQSLEEKEDLWREALQRVRRERALALLPR